MLGLLILAGCNSGEPGSEAAAFLTQGDTERALARLRPALEEAPDDPRLNHLYGKALLVADRASLAAWPLQRASRDAEWAVPSGLLLAESLLRTHNEAAAEAAADAVLAHAPGNLEAIRLRAQARMATHREAEALDDLALLIAAHPDSLAYQDRKLDALLALERFGEAEQVLAELEDTASGRPATEGLQAWLCARRARLALARDAEETASASLDGCLGAHPESLEVLRLAVGHFGSRQDETRVRSLLRAAVAAHPRRLDLRIDLAEHAERESGPDAAQGVLRAAAQEIDTPDAWLVLRNHQVTHDDLDGARASTDRMLLSATGMDPNQPDFPFERVPEDRLFEAAVVMAMAGESERARRLGTHLDEPVYRTLLEARLHFEAGELEEAVEAWERSFQRYPSNAGARHLAGLAAIRLGETGRGIEHLRNALRVGSAEVDSGWVLAQIYSEAGDTRSAMDALLYHLRAHPDDRRALRQRLRLAWRVGDGVSAQEAYSALFAVDEGEALAEHSAWILARGEAEEAVVFTEARLEEGPGHRSVLEPAYAAALAAAGRDQEARRVLEQVLANDDGSPQAHDAGLARAHRALADLDLEAKDLDTAVAHLRRSAELDSFDPTPLYRAAEALAAAGRQDEARVLLEGLLDERPWERRAAHWLARNDAPAAQGASTK